MEKVFYIFDKDIQPPDQPLIDIVKAAAMN